MNRVTLHFLVSALALLPSFAGAAARAGSAYDDVTAEGKTCEKKRDFVGAERCYKRAIKLDPNISSAHAMLGWIYTQTKRRPAAIKEERLAIELNSNDPDAHYHLGALLFMQKRMQEAADEYRESARIDPKRHCQCGPVPSLLKRYPARPRTG